MAIVPPLANPANRGDVHIDGRVDRADLAAMLGNFGARCGVGFHDGDLDADGRVSLADMLAWRRYAGTVYVSSPTAAVPEPDSTTLAWLGLLAVVVAARAIRQTELRRDHDSEKLV
jgi:hypothetical protein